MNQLDQQDITVIEQALMEAMNNTSDYQVISAYQDVLNKLKEEGVESAPSMKKGAEQVQSIDGFRYDYDDSSNV